MKAKIMVLVNKLCAMLKRYGDDALIDDVICALTYNDPFTDDAILTAKEEG